MIFWDVFILKVTGWTYYYPFKFAVILSYFFVGFLVRKGKLLPSTGFEITTPIFYIYSYVCMNYLHPTYIFSFYQGIIFYSFVYMGSFLRYSFISLLGFVLAFISIQAMPEPDFIKPGHSIKEHLEILTAILVIISIVVYHFFNRQREILYQKDQQFASIGRQAAFLLHELKSPLNRFIASNSEKTNNDAEYILSIIEGVELLISRKENLSFQKFEWSDIEKYLRSEFGAACAFHQIDLQISGFEGDGRGHRSTIRLALKNLVKNAIEAFNSNSPDRIIRVLRDKDTIEVSNNGEVVSKEKIDKLFEPFVSDKNSRTNLGIGLHFVETVVKAHNGHINVVVENGWSKFRMKLEGVK